MSNPFYYLFGMLLVFSYPTGIEPLTFIRPKAHPEWVAPVAVGLAFLLYALLVASVHRSIRLRGRYAVLGRARMLLRVTALLLFAVLIFVFHFPLWVWSLAGRGLLLTKTLLTLTPLFGFFGILAFFAARFDAALRPGGTGGMLGFAFRSFVALSLIPVLAMLSLTTTLENVELVSRLAYVYPVAGGAVVVIWILLLLAVLPLLLRLAFAARPLPAGPLRARMEALCRSVGFHYSRLLVVDTGALRMANAFIVGLGVPWRYVFFTDAILTGMTEEELECVLAHEIVHSKKRHMLFYLFFTVGFTLAALLGFEFLEGLPEAAVAALLLGWGAVYWAGAFGYVSRRFETEADLVAARWVEAPEGTPGPYRSARAMAGALGRVASLNRMPLTGWSWRHFNIATRVAILIGAEADPATGLAFERRCGRLRAVAVTLLLAGFVAGAWLAYRHAGRADAARARLAAYDLILEAETLAGRNEFREATEKLRTGIAAGANEADFWALLARYERELGRDEEARAAERQARKKGRVIDPRLRLELEQ